MVASHLIKPLIIMTQMGWGLVETSHLIPTLLLPCSQLLQLAEKLLPRCCLNISNLMPSSQLKWLHLRIGKGVDERSREDLLQPERDQLLVQQLNLDGINMSSMIHYCQDMICCVYIISKSTPPDCSCSPV